jgi:hypothetical protein
LELRSKVIGFLNVRKRLAQQRGFLVRVINDGKTIEESVESTGEVLREIDVGKRYGAEVVEVLKELSKRDSSAEE